jgi:TolB-like protein
MPDIFLSYSREDQIAARRFADGLTRAGFSVWWDQALKPGEAFDQVTEKALEEAKAVIVLWSKTAVSSRWVRAEATQANANNRLVPVMIEACKRPIMFELTHTADLAHWKGDADDPAWKSFVDDLRRFPGLDAVGADAPAPAPASASTPAAMPAAAAQRQRSMVPVIAAGLAAVLVLGAAWWALKPAPASAPIRMGVLPFTILSPDTDQRYLSEGLAEDLAIQLNQIKALRALGPASTRRFKDDEDPRAIARTLDVAEVLTGTVRRDGQQWLFTVNLIEGRDSTPRWSESYEGDDLFALRERIVKDVAKAVGVVLGVSDYSPTQGETRNVKAYEQYMRARDVFRTGGTYREMLPFLRKAVELDPGYKRAWLTTYITLRNVISGAAANELEAFREERREAAAQLENMPRDALLALRFRAVQMVEQHKWAEAIAAAEAGVAAAPTNEFDSNYILGLTLMCVGRIDDAIMYLQRSLETEPVHADATGSLHIALLLRGRDQDAEKLAARTSELGVTMASAPPTLEEMRKRLLEQAPPRRPDGTLAAPMVEGARPEVLDDPIAFLEAVRIRMEGADVRRMSPRLVYGYVYMAAREGWGELALAMARSHLAGRPEATLSLFYAPVWSMKQSRGSDAFMGFVRDFGLADYWRDSNEWSDFCRPKGKEDFECLDTPVSQAVQ